MKNVLMIAYYFPPLVNSGVQRTIKFVKYLRDYNWNPIVLTVDEANENPGLEHASLLNELPEDIKIYRTRLLGERLGFAKKDLPVKQDQAIGRQNSFNLARSIKNFVYSIVVPDIKLISWYPFAMQQCSGIFKDNAIDMIYSTSPISTPHLIAKS